MSEKQKANVVVRTEKYRDSKGKEQTRYIYGDVYANVTICTKTTEASIVGSYKIIDVETAKLKKSESFAGKANFECKWATFTGDKRALDKEAKRLVKKSEGFAPVAEEMVNQAAHNLSRSLASSLKEYAR